MRSQTHILGVCLLCVLPQVMMGAVAAAPASEVCRKLVAESREVDRILRTVSDRESGVAAAGELRTRMEYLRQSMEELGRLPLASGEEARAVEQMMRDLTHITQGYMQVVQLLIEVNAYGAEELISLFQYYKMSSPEAGAVSRTQESPLVRSYAEWCDSIDDMLFVLRRIQSSETAGAGISELRSLLERVETRAARAESLQAGLSPQQVESEQVPMERMRRLRGELRAELQRLRMHQCYGVGELQALLPVCTRAARG